MQWLMIAIGGALGSMARFASTTYLTPFFNARFAIGSFPAGTFVVNLLGSFLIGVLYVILVEKNNLSPLYRLFFITGFLGGYTTFSAFSLEMLQLWQEGNVAMSLTYAASSVVLGLLSVYMGMLITQKFS